MKSCDTLLLLERKFVKTPSKAYVRTAEMVHHCGIFSNKIPFTILCLIRYTYLTYYIKLEYTYIPMSVKGIRLVPEMYHRFHTHVRTYVIVHTTQWTEI